VRIAEVASLDTPVTKEGSASVESIVWSLSRGLTERGHEVTVFAAAGSAPIGELVVTLPGTYGEPGCPDEWQLCELMSVTAAIEQSDRFDVIHSHNYLWGMPVERFSAAPMLHTEHVLPHGDGHILASRYPQSWVTAISAYQWSDYPDVEPVATIHHGIDPADFTFQPSPEDYVCFLGRFPPQKGLRAAAAAARTACLPLRIAGPRDEFFDEHAAPVLDTDGASYVGRVVGRERDRFLGGARALLYPIEEPEPFGLVLIEAMMCGTPVVASPIGAVPELVEDGLTGCLAAPGEGLATAIERAASLDRVAVRERAVERFHVDRMVTDYERVLERRSRSRLS